MKLFTYFSCITLLIFGSSSGMHNFINKNKISWRILYKKLPEQSCSTSTKQEAITNAYVMKYLQTNLTTTKIVAISKLMIFEQQIKLINSNKSIDYLSNNDFKKMIFHGPTLSLYIDRGILLEEKGEFKKALHCYKNAIMYAKNNIISLVAQKLMQNLQDTIAV